MWFHISKTMTTISQNVCQTPTIDFQTLVTVAYPILCIFLTIDGVANSIEQQEDQHAQYNGMNTIFLNHSLYLLTFLSLMCIIGWFLFLVWVIHIIGWFLFLFLSLFFCFLLIVGIALPSWWTISPFSTKRAPPWQSPSSPVNTQMPETRCSSCSWQIMYMYMYKLNDLWP